MKQMQMRRSLRKFWSQTARPLLTILLVTCALRSAIADWNDVPTGSMKPTIIEGDRVFVNKLAYDLKFPFTTWHLAQWSNPKRGDIVVFFSPADGKRLVKRVVGIPGDQIELQNEQLFVNGQPAAYEPLPNQTPHSGRDFVLKETAPDAPSHAVRVDPSLSAARTFGPATVPADHFFMMGDNRDNSFDSRFFGPVARDQIIGSANAVVLSFDRSRYYLPRWNRFFSALK